MIAALYVQADGCYANLAGVDPWERSSGCAFVCRRSSGRGTSAVRTLGSVLAWQPARKPHQFELGDDDGKFEAALASVRKWGGVLEHPADSHAWAHFGLIAPPRSGGWVVADWEGGWTCYVEQGFYGHAARKGTWLYANGVELPSLRWGEGEQRLDPKMLELHGYEYARRKGWAAMVGGKFKKQIREATPPEFRDVLIAIARSAIKVREM